MSGARIERIVPDHWLAAKFLERARCFASDGFSTSLEAESRQVLLQCAVVAACDAVLAVEGRTVEGSDGGHSLRLTEAHRHLPDDHTELFDLLDDSRVSRNNASYAAGFSAPAEVDETAAAVRELLALVDQHVAPHLPEWRAQS